MELWNAPKTKPQSITDTAVTILSIAEIDDDDDDDDVKIISQNGVPLAHQKACLQLTYRQDGKLIHETNLTLECDFMSCGRKISTHLQWYRHMNGAKHQNECLSCSVTKPPNGPDDFIKRHEALEHHFDRRKDLRETCIECRPSTPPRHIEMIEI